MAKTQPISMRFDPDLYAALKAIGERDTRPLRNVIEVALREYVAREAKRTKKG